MINHPIEKSYRRGKVFIVAHNKSFEYHQPIFKFLLNSQLQKKKNYFIKQIYKIR